MSARLGAFGIACYFALASNPAAWSEEITAKTLVNRAQIQDLITRYYNNFGRENAENFSDFYASDAELILGDTHYKGKDGIMKAYGRSGDNAQPAARPTPYSFIVTISNPLIVVHGDTATSQLVFTEYMMEKQGDPLTLRTQGKEYSTFVKENGQWRYKTRQIKSGVEPPEGWKE